MNWDFEKEDDTMNIVIQITEKDMQKGSWVREEMLRLAERLSGAEAMPLPEPAQEAPAPAKPDAAPEPTVSVEEVRAAIAKVSRKHGTERAKAILRKFGAENLSALAREHYAAAMKEAEEAL